MPAALPARPSGRVRVSGVLFDRRFVERLDRHFAAEFSVGYGTTEVGRISAGVFTVADFQFGCVGELHPEVRLITSGDRQNPAPLVIAHDPALHRSYYAGGDLAPLAAAELYTLPDLGFVEHGRLYLAGRDDEVFNLDGNKTAYGEIEAALRAQPGVDEVAVVSSASLGDISGLVIGVVGGDGLDMSALDAVFARVVKAPRARARIFRLAAVPRNSFGKTDRDRVIAAYRPQAGGAMTFTASPAPPVLGS